jgi:hypothetical protein
MDQPWPVNKIQIHISAIPSFISQPFVAGRLNPSRDTNQSIATFGKRDKLGR